MGIRDDLATFFEVTNKECGWSILLFNWEAGVVTLQHNLYEDEPMIIFTRDYLGGEWDYNMWGIRFTSSVLEHGFDFNQHEMMMLANALTMLQNAVTKYPKNGDEALTEDIIQFRMAYEEECR